MLTKLGNQMSDTEFQNFIDNYTESDFDKIKFKWNGKSGDEFYDDNYYFRINLTEYFISDIENVNSDLIRDLYNEMTKCSKPTFGIYNKIHILGQEMLKRDWRKYILDYMIGGTYGMDSYLGTGRINIDQTIAKEIYEYLKIYLKKTDDENIKSLSELNLKRFEYLSTK